MDMDKEIEALGESVNEMLSSAAAVKGQAFVEAVVLNFALVQLMDMVKKLASVANEESREFASALYASSMDVAANLAANACGDLSDDDVKEVMKMSSALNKRRNDTGAAIMKGLEDDES